MLLQNRRRALGMASALCGVIAGISKNARACPMEGVTAGTEIAPGVREVFLQSQEVRLARFKLLWMAHLIFAPGASTARDATANDMVILLEQGLLRVQLDEQDFGLCGVGGLWGVPEGAMLSYHNTGADTAVPRVIDLLPGL